MIELSIVIPTYQRCQSLYHVLLACAQQTLPSEQYEVIVTIDGSSDGTVAMLRHLNVPYRLQWTIGLNNGPGVARNRGAALAKGNIILFLDDDIILARAALAAHLAGHQTTQQNRAKRVCLGQVRGWQEQSLSLWSQYLNQRFEEHYQKMGQPHYQPNYWDCLSGNISLPKSLFMNSGGFNPVFATTRHEDIEWGIRLASLGAIFTYEPHALGYHNFVKSVNTGLNDATSNGISAVRLVRLHPHLYPPPTLSIWQHYPVVIRVFLRYLWQWPRLQIKVTSWSRSALHWVTNTTMPMRLKRPFFRIAYQLHFWLGVYTEAHPAEWQAIQKSL